MSTVLSFDRYEAALENWTGCSTPPISIVVSNNTALENKVLIEDCVHQDRHKEYSDPPINIGEMQDLDPEYATILNEHFWELV